MISVCPLLKRDTKKAAKVEFSSGRRYHAPMATPKRKERTLTPAEQKAMRFMGARMEENERRYQEFLDTLDPRERERLALGDDGPAR